MPFAFDATRTYDGITKKDKANTDKKSWVSKPKASDTVKNIFITPPTKKLSTT